MNNNSKKKKEVSCKPLFPILNAARKRGMETDRVLEGIPYNLSYLLNRHERIEWWVWCKIITNLRPYFSPSDFEQMGKEYVEKEHYIAGYIFSFIFFSSSKLSNILIESLRKKKKSILKPIFSCVHEQITIIKKNKWRFSLSLDPGYEQCPEWFYMSKGVWEKLGSQVGLKGFKIDLTITSDGGFYIVSWEEEGFFIKLKKRVKWLFNIRKAFADLTESHEELLKHYNKLEESKKLLQKQTTSLTTAYDIAMSIRKSQDVNKTLQTITSALVNDANLSYAGVRLFKDIEGNSLDAKVSSGAAERNVKLISHPIVINEEKIGELNIYPKLDTDISELEEIINHLIPIINISIHDSLVLRTITDYKKNLEIKVDQRTGELRKAQKKLSEIIEAQNRFFTNISHEFRTPLAVIQGLSSQIVELTTNTKIKDEVKVIYGNAKKLNTLANQLLDISRIETGGMKLKTRNLNLVSIAKRITYSFQSFAETKNISLNFHAESEDIVLYIDEDKIDKILNNILSNALKFTPQGGRVDVELCTANGTAEIKVSDNGIGIPKEHLDKIFDRFYQIDNRLSREHEGTGIGLSLTKELVEVHKGEIVVKSEEGKGSVFIVILPSGKEHLLPEEIEEIPEQVKPFGEEKRASIQSSLSIPGSSQDEHIYAQSDKKTSGIESIEVSNRHLLLIIEDNYDLRKYIADILGDFYKIIEASDGEEGLQRSFKEIPDLIISDIMMPKVDGIKLCQSLKSDTRTSHIPLILLTAKTTLEDKVRGLQIGADDYITKPFEAQELRARIKNLLEQRQRVHEHFKKFGIIIEEERMTSIDQRLLKQTITLINDNLSNSSFNVERLARELAVSRSLLHKKLVLLLGEPPRELIKRTRLNKAAKLIEQRYGNITEISFEVGFDNPSYFAKCFQKQFGFSPSQYHRASAQR